MSLCKRPEARRIVPDGKLEVEWHDTTLVEHLRRCFRWAGLPELAYFAEERGKEELQALTEGLLPL